MPIQFVSIAGKDLFSDQYGQYRYVNATYTNIVAEERKNSNGTVFHRGTIQVPGDSKPSRTVNVFGEMLKDIQVGQQGLTRVRVSKDADGVIQLGFQFSYGEGGQNALEASAVESEWGFTMVGTEAISATQDEVIGEN